MENSKAEILLENTARYERECRSGFVIAYSLVAMSGALVGFLTGWFCK